MAISFPLRHFVAITAFLALAGYVAIYAPGDKAPIRSDGYSYYVYLPSWLIYHDVTLEAPARECCGGAYPVFTGITRWPGTGRWVNPHPIGLAILIAPFFVVAHLLTLLTHARPDGFSFYYQHAAGLAGLAYMLAGLAIVRRILVRHFSPGVALAALVTITWGTNLFHYGVYDSVFSHAFSFFLIAALVELTERWWAAPRPVTAVVLGLTAALIVLTRHTNALFLLLLPLYGLTGWTSFGPRARELWARRESLAIVAMVAVAGVLPQVAIYRMATGAWLASPYGGLDVGFHFGSPRLFEVLFSTEKGLFFWSPACLLAVVGWMTAEGWASSWVVAAGAIFALDVYTIASWSDWQYGGSFGHRAFTDSFALVAVLMAACFQWTSRRPRLAIGAAIVTSLAVMLSIAQMMQYWAGILPMANITWDQYRDLFLKFY